MTPEEVADLAHLRPARDRMDRDHAEPVAQPWGARDSAFRDPSGNLVRIAQA